MTLVEENRKKLIDKKLPNSYKINRENCEILAYTLASKWYDKEKSIYKFINKKNLLVNI